MKTLKEKILKCLDKLLTEVSVLGSLLHVERQHEPPVGRHRCRLALEVRVLEVLHHKGVDGLWKESTTGNDHPTKQGQNIYF